MDGWMDGWIVRSIILEIMASSKNKNIIIKELTKNVRLRVAVSKLQDIQILKIAQI